MTDLADRYAPSRHGRPLAIVCAVTLSVVFLGWLAWSTWFHSTPEASSEMVSFAVEGDHEAVADVEIHLKDETVVATCTVRAMADDHTVVGERSIGVPGAEPWTTSSKTISIVVRTERRATSVELVGCTTPEQSRPR